jgi:hypothetical protein
MTALGQNVYRAHVRELLRRLQADGGAFRDLLPMTKAEVLCGLHAASLQAPLTAVGTALFQQLFCELFPGKLAEELRIAAPDGFVADEVATELRVATRRSSPERAAALKELERRAKRVDRAEKQATKPTKRGGKR